MRGQDQTGDEAVRRYKQPGDGRRFLLEAAPRRNGAQWFAQNWSRSATVSSYSGEPYLIIVQRMRSGGSAPVMVFLSTPVSISVVNAVYPRNGYPSAACAARTARSRSTRHCVLAAVRKHTDASHAPCGIVPPCFGSNTLRERPRRILPP